MVEFEAGELMLPIKSLEARLRWRAVFIEKLCSRVDFPRTAMGLRRHCLLAPMLKPCSPVAQRVASERVIGG
jgi:hypothetical protein